MPIVTVEVEHALSQDSAKEKVEPVIPKLIKEFRGSGESISWDDYNGGFAFTSMGMLIKGKTAVKDKAVEVSIDLPWGAAMFKGRVEKSVSESLEKALN